MTSSQMPDAGPDTAEGALRRETLSTPAPPRNRPRPAPRRRWGRIATLSAIGVVLVGVAWATLLRPLPVTLVTLLPADVPVEIAAPGTLEARRLARIGFGTSGRIVALDADIGESLAAGTEIGRLDDATLAAALDNARAGEAAALTGVDAARADERSAEATLANARDTLGRTSGLVGSGAASNSDNDKARTDVATATAALDKAEAARLAAESDAVAATASRRQAESKIDDAVIRAPFSGVVTARDASLGDAVAANVAVVEMADPASIYVEARFDETALGQLAAGQAARVVLRSAPDVGFGGHVLRIGRAVDSDTREVTVEIALDSLPPAWAIAQRADVSITTGTAAGALAVPPAAVRWTDGRSFVWREINGRARRAPVTLGPSGPAGVLIRDGLAAGDRVVVAGDPRPFRRLERAP